MSTEKHTELPFSKVREAVELVMQRNGGPTRATVDGKTYVLVLAQDFSALEHYLRATWVDDRFSASYIELLEACREALSCVREWEEADLVLHTNNLQNRLATAIQHAEQLRHE